MMGRVGALITGLFLIIAAVLLLSPGSGEAAAAETCAPTTFDDLTSTTTTTVVESSTTTSAKDSTTTSVKGKTTTTIEEETTTTEAPAKEKRPAHCDPFVYDLTFPLAARGSFISGFGDERDGGGRLHRGVDLAGPLLSAVRAVRSGHVAFLYNDPGSEDCCWMAIEHEDGWQSWYIHLNNDNYGTDDGEGHGIRIDLEVGDEVAQGEVIGWLGDSGNAEDTNTPHIHFELHRPDGMAIDPYASLVAAASGMEAAEDDAGAYQDDNDALYEWVFDDLATRGIYWPCDPVEALACARDLATPEQLGALTSLLTGAEDPPLLVGGYGEVPLMGEEQPHQYLIDKVLGCEEDGDTECPVLGVTEAELARLAIGIIRYRRGPELRPALPDEVWPLKLPSGAKALAVLESSGRVPQCHLPLDHSTRLSRGRAVDLLLSWIGDSEPIPCPVFDLPPPGRLRLP